MISTMLYNFSTAGYVFSLAFFGLHVVLSRKAILRIGLLIVASSFLLQTAGMFSRWIEAGYVEVLAAEKAIGQSLSGWSWFVVFSQHPPWSNLYEIMIYMSWGIVLVTLACELKWQLMWLRQIGMVLTLMALGMAALTDASIKPLVPALKSWWIMIHVISASIAYAAGSMAAFIALFALLKDDARLKKTKLIGGALIAFALLTFSLGGGLRLLFDQAYYVKLLAYAGESMINVLDMTKENPKPFYVPMPALGILLLVSTFFQAALGLYLVFICSELSKKSLSQLLLTAIILSTIVIAGMLFHDFRQTPIQISASVSHHLSPEGPWFLGFRSHAWSFGLALLTLFLQLLFLGFLLKPGSFGARLPSVANLEAATYRALSLSFFLMTIVLITGALWAHYAWGRYWAWDPKETGALAIWITYAIYLHSRRTPGLSGPFSSVIAVLGFFVIIIGFLGVNLGLFADGLHSYGNS
jgi:ABC-type transport system involved in cytochrome c biogenesis permease subunit